MNKKEKKVKEMTGVASIAGVQAPKKIKVSKKNNENFNNIEEKLRKFIRHKIKEIVRKNQGGGGYSLYAPKEKGSKKPAKKVGEFPTRIQAKQAQLRRFPPRDPAERQALKDVIDKLLKNPKKAYKADTETQPKIKDPIKKESFNKFIVGVINEIISESVFRESNDKESEWTEFIDNLPEKVVEADKRLKNLVDSLNKICEKAVENGLKSLEKVFKKSGFEIVSNKKSNVKNYYKTEFGIRDKKDSKFMIKPLFLYIKNGNIKIEVSESASADLTRLKPDRNKTLRTNLLVVQEDFLDKDDSIKKSISKRDDYLNKTQNMLDKQLSGMGSIEIVLLKRLLKLKYRKLS